MERTIDISMEFLVSGNVHLTLTITIDGEEHGYQTLHEDANAAFAEAKRTMRLHGFPFPQRDKEIPAPGATIHRIEGSTN